MAVVTFDQTTFLSMFPEFTNTLTNNPNSAQAYFGMAGSVYLDNRDCSRVPVPPRDTLLYLLTAHLLAIFIGTDKQPASQAVGRVASAGQGSVNVSLQMGATTDQREFYLQTKYGAAYWRASMGYRLAMIVPAADQPTSFFIQEG